MAQADLTTEQRMLLSTVYDLWAVSHSRWPAFAQVDKVLDAHGIDAETVLRFLVPRYVLLDAGDVGSVPGQLLSLSVRGLAELPGPPAVTKWFLTLLRYLSGLEQSHDPQPPADLQPTANSTDFARYLETSASVPRPPQVAQRMSHAVGHLLHGEGHLWTRFGSHEDGSWDADVSRRIRRFRDVATLADYLARVDLMLSDTDRSSVVDQQRAEDGGVAAVAEMPGIDPRAVFVVHGRDLVAKQAVCGFLRDLDLRPLDWEQLVTATGSAAPYIGDAVSVAFQLAQAVVVLLTPDDEARLLPTLHGDEEPAHETNFTGQARPNVLFEAGMALASHPDRTILVEIGRLRPFSDVAGRHTVRLTGSAATLHALATRLQTAGCPVDVTGSGWLDESRFRELEAQDRRPVPAGAPNRENEQSEEPNLPLGALLSQAPRRPAPPRLSATVRSHGTNYLVEIANSGGVALRNISLVLPAEAHNWHLMTDVLPAWPIPTLAPRDYIRFPAAVTMGGPVVVEARLLASTPDGQSCEQPVTLSVYG
jgi:predicted nucleotide-binding protein